MAKKKTNEEFTKEVFDLVGDEYEFLEEYKTVLHKITCRHNKCGYEWIIVPGSFLGGTRCPECGKQRGLNIRNANNIHRKTNEEFSREVYELVGDEYEFLEKYVNTRTKIECRHNACGYRWSALPSGFLRGTGCPNCFTTPLKTNQEFTDEVHNLTKNEYTFTEKYVNYHTKIKCKHNKCKHTWKVSPSSFLSGRRCPRCSTQEGYGYLSSASANKNKPEWLNIPAKVYLIQCTSDDESFFKIGVTTTTTEKRVRGIPYKCAILDEIETNLYDAVFIEKRLQNTHKEYKYMPDTKFGGWTECFSELLIKDQNIA